MTSGELFLDPGGDGFLASGPGTMLFSGALKNSESSSTENIFCCPFFCIWKERKGRSCYKTFITLVTEH